MDAALCIQTYFRRYVAMKKYRLIMDTLTRIQAIAKGRKVREKYELLKAANGLPCFYQGSDVKTVLVLPSSGSFTGSELTEAEDEGEDLSDEETQQAVGGESESDEDEEG